MSTLLVMAGGTGGHVYPALAVAQALRRRGVNVVWMGTRTGIEARAVPAAGFDIEWINVRGLRGQGPWRWLLAPVLIAWAVVQAAAVIFRRRPDALLGMGGFVSGPGGLAAWLLRRPLLVHEANAIAGSTNRVLGRLALRVMTGFPDVLDGRRGAEWVGNPVREEIAALTAPTTRLAGRASSAPRLLVIGGSQGARVFNETLPAAVGAMAERSRPALWHQCGRGNGAEVAKRYRAAGVDARVDEFVDDMAGAYGWADLVVSRAGAMAIAEIAAAGVAAILVPYPHAVGDHQSANARFLAARGAALVVSQAEMSARQLAEMLRSLLGDRSRLLEMAQKARALSRPQATQRVADICMEAVHA